LKLPNLPLVYRNSKRGSNDLIHFSIDQFAFTPPLFKSGLKLPSHDAPNSTGKVHPEHLPILTGGGSTLRYVNNEVEMPADGTEAAAKTRDFGTSRWPLSGKSTLSYRVCGRGSQRQSCGASSDHLVGKLRAMISARQSWV
jgi:hypothetical protein